MPSSNIALALDCIALVDQVPHDTVLDIGPGHGKYGLLLREYLNVPIVRLDAIEAEASYVARFPWLECIYDRVVVGDGSDMHEVDLDPYDVVMLYDVIEHIKKAAALELLDRIRGCVCIVTPVEFFTQHVDGVPSEDHVSHWTVDEFAAMSRCEVLYESHGGVICRLGPR